MRNVSFQLKHQVKAVTQSPINSVWFLQIVNWIRDSAVIWTNFWLNIWTIILNGFIFKWAYKTALSKGKWQKWRNVFFWFCCCFSLVILLLWFFVCVCFFCLLFSCHYGVIAFVVILVWLLPVSPNISYHFTSVRSSFS